VCVSVCVSYIYIFIYIICNIYIYIYCRVIIPARKSLLSPDALSIVRSPRNIFNDRDESDIITYTDILSLDQFLRSPGRSSEFQSPVPEFQNGEMFINHVRSIYEIGNKTKYKVERERGTEREMSV